MTPDILPLIDRVATDARIVVDMSAVRFPAAHDETAPDPDPEDPAVSRELAGLAGADAIVTATGPDRGVVERFDPTLPVFVWNALGEPAGADRGGTPDGSLLYVGDLLHQPNALGIEWWLDLVAARVEARMGGPVPLRVVGNGSDLYRAIWRHPRKVELAGWQLDLHRELAAARLLALPLTFGTGTGGRMITALAAGLPVVAAAPAAALLPEPLARLVAVGSGPVEFAEAICDLLTDDARWEATRSRILDVDVPGLRDAQADRFAVWLASIEPRDQPKGGRDATRKPGTRRGLRRPLRAS